MMTPKASQQVERPTKRLYRSERNRMLAGVAGGIAEYFGIDPTIVRVVFVLLTIWGGSGILIYLLLWFIVPTESSVGQPLSEDTVKANAKEFEARARQLGSDAQRFADSDRSRSIWGIILVVVGLAFLLGNFGVFFGAVVGALWPVILLIIGVILIADAGRKS